MSIIAHYKSRKFTKKYPHLQSIYNKSQYIKRKKVADKFRQLFYYYLLNNIYSADSAGVSATSAAGASSALGADALRERRVRPCFFADFSFNMFSL